MPTVPPGGLAVRPDLCRPRQNAKEAQAGEDLSGRGEDLQLNLKDEIIRTLMQSESMNALIDKPRRFREREWELHRSRGQSQMGDQLTTKRQTTQALSRSTTTLLNTRF